MTFNALLKTTSLYFFLLCSLFVSTIIALNATDWFFIWAALEINMISFIPLLFFGRSPQTWNGATEYFFPQAAGSLLILTAAVTLLSEHTHTQASSVMIFIALLVKGGFAPFHYWFVNVFSTLNSWALCLLISTWQKIIPVFFLSSSLIVMDPMLVMFTATLGASWGMLSAANQTDFQMFIAYSSVGNLGWFLMLTPTTKFAALSFFFMYTLMLTTLISLLYSLSPNTTPNFSSATQMNTPHKAAVTLCLLSLAGFPFTTGFLMKIWVIMSAISQTSSMLWLIFIPLVFSTVAYARFIFYLLFNSPSSTSPLTNTGLKILWSPLMLLLSIHCAPAMMALLQLSL
uniref:NADH-ubiquinone oxidoreductase chain 2 n=1 Tax=Cirriformia cf. tentaculata HK-2018 TaxID=2100094 RepID=A0A343UWF3_9ANNE|nr:NADH dehydrogenase subunit 2 [Cirriformia cf. tentaculata HK-2018]AVI26181.1 NADH dehydrogenase subunit 2 [Cirriformia cf. tentaculata HK-2018]